MRKRNLLMFVMLASVAPLSAHQRPASSAHHGCPHGQTATASDGLPVGGSLLELSASSTFAP